MGLTSKERMQITMNHEEPDRVPFHANFVPELQEIIKKRYDKELGEIDISFKEKHQSINNLDILFKHDMLLLSYGLDTSYYRETDFDTYIDEWGITWEKVPYKTKFGVGHYTEIINCPLADDNALDNYTPPNPHNEDMEYAEEIISKYGNEYYMCGVVSNSTFEALRYLRGTTQGLIDVVANKEIAHRIMRMAADYHVILGKKLIDLGVDMLLLGDDFGAEYSMLISPETFREMIKPHIAYMIDEFKKKNKNIKIAFHSDGYIEPVIDDLIEIGIDLLNPVQPESMDPAHLKKKYGKKISFWGTISTQRTIPFGSPGDVENEVKERMRTCGKGGGFIISPTHNFQLDVPIENIEAFYKAVKKYGKY